MTSPEDEKSDIMQDGLTRRSEDDSEARANDTSGAISRELFRNMAFVSNHSP